MSFLKRGLEFFLPPFPACDTVMKCKDLEITKPTGEATNSYQCNGGGGPVCACACVFVIGGLGARFVPASPLFCCPARVMLTLVIPIRQKLLRRVRRWCEGLILCLLHI